ncbi:MAG: hypothetical protein WKF68_07925 [Daejeonella sp.]
MKNKGLRLIVLSLLTAAWMLIMKAMTATLHPMKVIQFEFIGTANNATDFLSGLRNSGELELLTRSIFLDFIFPLLYGATFYYASAWVCSKLKKDHIFNRFRLLGSLTILAVMCDFIENVSLLKLIYYPPADLYAYSAYFFASLKFLLLGLVVIHFLMSGMIVIEGRKWKTTPGPSLKRRGKLNA